MTPEQIEKLRETMIEWTFYAKKFGIACEILNGVYTNDDLERISHEVLALLSELSKLRAVAEAAKHLASRIERSGPGVRFTGPVGPACVDLLDALSALAAREEQG